MRVSVKTRAQDLSKTDDRLLAASTTSTPVRSAAFIARARRSSQLNRGFDVSNLKTKQPRFSGPSSVSLAWVQEPRAGRILDGRIRLYRYATDACARPSQT